MSSPSRRYISSVVCLTVIVLAGAHAGEAPTAMEPTVVSQVEESPSPVITAAAPRSPRNDQLGLGPLHLGSQSPGQSLRLGLVPHTPADLLDGEWKYFVGSSWVNVWANEATHQLDYEALTTEALVGYGLSDRWALELGALHRVTFGGRMDAMIQGFHEIFDLGQDGRDEVPLNRTYIHIDPNADQPGLELGENELQDNHLFFLRGSLQYTVSDGRNGWPALAVGCTVQAPVGSRRGYSGGLIDVSLDLSLAKPIGDVVLWGSVAYTRFGADELYGLHLYRSNWSGLGVLEWRVTKDWSLILQYLLSQGVAPDLYSFSKPSNELVMGTQVRVGNHTILQLGVIENVFIFDNSPDFGVHLALEMRL